MVLDVTSQGVASEVVTTCNTSNRYIRNMHLDLIQPTRALGIIMLKIRGPCPSPTSPNSYSNLYHGPRVKLIGGLNFGSESVKMHPNL